MSTLETKVAPYVGPMMHGVALTLARQQQEEISAWAVKIAMVLEATRHGRSSFYTYDDRQALRLSYAIPTRSLIWLGMLSTEALHCDGLDLSLNVDGTSATVPGCITTIVIGQLILQILTAELPDSYQNVVVNFTCRAGPWTDSLVGIWPSTAGVVWPPPRSFSLRGALPFGALFYRWRYGTKQESLR